MALDPRKMAGNFEYAKRTLANQMAGQGDRLGASLDAQQSDSPTVDQPQGPQLTDLITMMGLSSPSPTKGQNPGGVQIKNPGDEQAGGAWKPGGNWKGPYGAIPQHHGWAGMQDPAKEWTLRLLGAFPQLRFSSGYRSPEANAAANGAPNSGHMRGWKADFSGNSKWLHEAAAWAKRYGARTYLHDAGSGYHLDISFEGMGI